MRSSLRPRDRSSSVKAIWNNPWWALIATSLVIGCGQPKANVKGAAPNGNPSTVLAVRAGDTSATPTIEGVLVEKCPVAGCWFKLQDGTGVIKVDTKTAGFVVTDIPLQTKLTVGGKIGWEGDEAVLQATGVRY